MTKGLSAARVYLHFCVFMGKHKHLRVSQFRWDDMINLTWAYDRENQMEGHKLTFICSLSQCCTNNFLGERNRKK